MRFMALEQPIGLRNPHKPTYALKNRKNVQPTSQVFAVQAFLRDCGAELAGTHIWRTARNCCRKISYAGSIVTTSRADLNCSLRSSACS